MIRHRTTHPLSAALIAAGAFVGAPPASGSAQAVQPAGQSEHPTAQSAQPMGIALENLPYPYPVSFLPLVMEGEDVRLGYMDVAPTGPPNGETVVLLHGFNFFGEYWGGTVAELTRAGYRVVVPDQIGFGRSSKPVVPYSFHGMGRHTADLLDHLGVDEVKIVGHSMGGMLAVRFALMYPERTELVILANTIGMEDARLQRPWRSVEEAYRANLDRSLEAIRAGQERYYVEWRPEFEKYVDVHYGWTLGGEWPHLARVRALTGQLLYEQPVVHEYPHLRVPVTILAGAEDGPNFRELSARTRDAIPGAVMHLLDGVGHNPHLEAPERFHPLLLEALAGVL